MNRALISFLFLAGLAGGCASAGSADSGGGGESELAIASYTTAFHGGDKRLSISGDTPGGSGEDIVALLQWDLASAIPSSAIVRGVKIRLTVTDKADQTYSLYELRRAWDEATATWRVASTGTTWAADGAAGAADRAPAVLGTIRAASTGTYTITLNSAGVAAVQSWVSDPSTNRGIIIAGPGNTNRLEIQSSEDTKSGRPRLEVSWEPGDGGGATLDSTPGTYRQTCDGSGAVAVDFGHFLDLSDEDQVLRIFTRATAAAPVQQLDIGGGLDMDRTRRKRRAGRRSTSGSAEAPCSRSDIVRAGGSDVQVDRCSRHDDHHRVRRYEERAFDPAGCGRRGRDRHVLVHLLVERQDVHQPDAVPRCLRRGVRHRGLLTRSCAAPRSASGGTEGDVRKRLDGVEFYKVIGRPDLAKQYQNRMNGGIAAMVGGSVVMLGGFIYMTAKANPDLKSCFGVSNEEQCERDGERAVVRNLLVGGAISLTGSVIFLVGVHYARNPHPISEGEAQALGQQHNTELRRKHKLSTGASPRPRARNVVVTPYIGGDGGGLAIGGHF